MRLNSHSHDRLSTAELLQVRQRTGSKPGARTDGRSLALVIEGGGMRGVIPAGMLVALEEIGLRDCFDAVYGASAGAIAGAYFVAGQARYGATLYSHINNRRFINLWRLARRRPVVSLDFVLDEICSATKPLDYQRVLQSDIPLRILAASIGLKRAVILKNFGNRDELFEGLRASSTIPFFAGPPVHFRGDRYLDASLYVSIPFRAAVEDNATDVVVLLSRPKGYLRRRPSWINRHLVVPFLASVDPALPPLYMVRAEKYRAEIENIQNHSTGDNLPAVLLIHPAIGAQNIGAFETSARKLSAGIRAGESAVYGTLGMTRQEIKR
jgi:predicted patatin/cPLA2 family phospholipase